ncbi:MAG: glycyl-radical enzyme activating protein [Synergistetes bacterium]|nr:glycyl-radical enzyme activating protein [Synergistota bacterium]
MSGGIIFDIKRFSVHDGPGIRTTIFFKGCPLSCWWCHNPESQSMNPELMLWPDRCIGCETCIKVCPNKAVSLIDNMIVTNRKKCVACGVCADNCPASAREIVGRRVSVEELLRDIEKDVTFYDESGGGVTISGGEPFLQWEFLENLLKECREREIHTAVDTTGYVDSDVILRVSDVIELFLYDLKLMDDSKHKYYTGVSNGLILKNLKLLDSAGKRIFARFPLIPGINDDEDNIRKTAEFVSGLSSVEEIDVLPYHKGGEQKAKRIGKRYLYNGEQPTDEVVERVVNLLQGYGLKVKIGG